MRDQTTEVLDPVARLRGFIKEGGFSGGGRLPPERHLSDQLGLSRATLRKALDALERDGVIWRHVGKGTFVSDGPRPEADQTGPMVDLARQLTPEEDAYLSKVEKRFQRVQQTGTIYDHDMVRLHPKWTIQSVDPLPLWPEAPATLREFWDYVALALTEIGRPGLADDVLRHEARIGGEVVLGTDVYQYG